MALLGFELLFRFMWGSLFVLSFVSRTETSERFPRIASYIALGCTVCAVFLLRFDAPESVAMMGDPRFWGLVALGLGAFIYAHVLGRVGRSFGFALYFLSCIGILWNAPILGIVNFFTSSLVLGSVFAGQYLGHWYLTVPGLHISELRKVVRFLFIALGVKTFEILCSLAIRQSPDASSIDIFGRPLGLSLDATANLDQLNLTTSFFSLEGDTWMGFGLFGFIVFLTRVLWGILAPFLLAVMIKKTVDMRSTQSATGILYALCVMILVGEGCALYLIANMGIFL